MSKRLKKLIMMTITASTIFFSSATMVFAETGATTSLDAFKQSVVDHMENRETTFTINYTGDYSTLVHQLENIMNQAPKADDYLAASLLSERVSVQNSNGNSAVTFNVEYVEDKDQIAYVDEKVNEIVASVVTSDMTAQQKVKALHDYVCKITEYDESLKEITDYTALTDGKTVCRGYAMLLYKLYIKAGIPTHIVLGTLDGGGHAWNLVQVDGNWYHVDATNDDANDSTRFFMVSDSVLRKYGFWWDTKSVPAANGDTNKSQVSVTSQNDAATKAVETAETTLSLRDEMAAEKLVSKLTNGDIKTALVNRLSAVKLQIAQAAVTNAEKNPALANIDNANRIISLLTDGSDKTDLINRVQTVQQTMLLNNAAKAVTLAEKTKSRFSYALAQMQVRQLKDSPEKTALINRLNAISLKR